MAQWELHPPPGMRFVNWHGSGVVLQFPDGAEDQLAEWLHAWVDHMHRPHEYAAPIAERETAKESPQAKDTLPPSAGPAQEILQRSIPTFRPFVATPAQPIAPPPPPQGAPGMPPMHHVMQGANIAACGRTDPPLDGVSNWTLVNCPGCLDRRPAQ